MISILIHVLFVTSLLLKATMSIDVCISGLCKCTKKFTVNCDSKQWKNLTDKEFPADVTTLTLIQNQLKFDTLDDRSKIEQLANLIDLSLNGNPLEAIPPFNVPKMRSLSLQDTFLTSVEFPSSFMSSALQTISLSNNKIRSINDNDFLSLKTSKIKKLHIDKADLSTIDRNAFTPLVELQSLSLQQNYLKSSEFLTTFRVLASIHLDGNRFTSLPTQISTLENTKNFFFTNNLISVIDDSSPLYSWLKANRTDLKIYLANNSFDCCQSLWFIRFLKSASDLVGDAKLLTCVTPSNYAGEYLMTLDPDKMNCGEIPPKKTGWTIETIVGVTIGGLASVSILIIIIIINVRRQRLRSGYTEIGSVDDLTPSTSLLIPPQDLPFPEYGEGDDAISTYSTAPSRNTYGSHKSSVTTTTRVTADDLKQI